MRGGEVDYECARGVGSLGPHVELMSRKRGGCECVGEVGSKQMRMTMKRMWSEEIWEMSQKCLRMKRCDGTGVEEL